MSYIMICWKECWFWDGERLFHVVLAFGLYVHPQANLSSLRLKASTFSFVCYIQILLAETNEKLAGWNRSPNDPIG